MNRIYISREVKVEDDESTLFLNYSNANKMLSALRSEHFTAVTLADTEGLVPKDLKFLMQLTRLLKTDGQVHLLGTPNQNLNNVIKRLGLFQHTGEGNSIKFLRSAPVLVNEKKEDKLAIGFHANEEEQQIDQNELLEGEGIKVDKKKAENCDVKPRACANCNCGRKDTQKTVSKQELVQAVNQGKPVSGCGKCLLGDSFRCGTCPYKGLPAFKPGDKLKLEQNGGVSVQPAATFVSVGGKIKLQL